MSSTTAPTCLPKAFVAGPLTRSGSSSPTSRTPCWPGPFGARSAGGAPGYSLLLTDSEGDPSLDAAQIQVLQRRRADGLLLSLADEEDPETAAALRAVDVPIVLVDRDLPPGVTAPRALFDHRKGMRQAGKHLAELGHRDVAVIIGGPRRPARERRTGLESALRRRRRAVQCVRRRSFAQTRLRGDDRDPCAYASTHCGRGWRQPPDARGLRALAEAGIQVGADMSFVGCDDVAVAEFHRPAIAVVQRDVLAMGEAAAGLLLQALDERRQGPMRT